MKLMIKYSYVLKLNRQQIIGNDFVFINPSKKGVRLQTLNSLGEAYDILYFTHLITIQTLNFVTVNKDTSTHLE